MNVFKARWGRPALFSLVMLVAMSLSACTTTSQPQEQHLTPPLYAQLTPEVKLQFPQPQAMELNLQQLLTAQYHSPETDAINEQSVVVLLEHTTTPCALDMAVLSNLGIRLLHARFDESGVELSKLPILPESLNPTQVLCDILLCYYPVSAFTLPEGWSLQESATQRLLTAADGTVVYTIDYEQIDGKKLPVKLTQSVFNYTIELSYF